MVFLDSSYIIARLYENQRKHNRAIKLNEYIENETKLINTTVLMEVLNSINYAYQIDSSYVLNTLLKVDNIHYLNNDDFLVANNLFKHYNYAINFQDCLILKTMQDYETNRIISFDNHFLKIKGLKVLR